ncbi:helix-turn-helix domain-containing protein [Sphaerisporangium dianthi]|uniref:Helix-turn-helix domain-containing protein n=1 Tax=Sphaerisporangium dianthi TaxID=1436120 RepID=A0ABV9CN77_9ACTN
MLEILGVDHWSEEAYLALIDGDPLTADELAGVTTVGRDLLGAVLQRLEDRGLVCRVPGHPVRYAALPPETAIEVLLLSRERDIKRVRALAHHLGERHRTARSGQDAAELIEVISGPDAVARSGQQLLRRAQKTIRGIDAPPYARAIDGERVSSHVNVLERTVRRRFIHEHGTLMMAGQTRHIEASLAAGEEVRVLANVPMKMILADDDLGLIPLRATPRVLDSCILVHPSSLLDALSTLFEMLWRQAQPFLLGQDAADGAAAAGSAGADGEPPLSKEERRIISLLALGLPDEAIARQLDMGHRTVQRRIQALMVRLSATSRFQAGILAARRGWWDPDAHD